MRPTCLLAILLCCAPLAAHGGQFPPPPSLPRDIRLPPPPATSPPMPSAPSPSGPTTPRPTTPQPVPPAPTTRSPAPPTTPPPAPATTPPPSQLGPTTPRPPGGGGTAGPARPTTGPRGAPLQADPTVWELWWRYNHHRFLDLRRAVHAQRTATGSDEFYMGAHRRRRGHDSLRPTAAQLQALVLPALRDTLRSDVRDIVSASIVALAKVGRDHRDFQILPLIRAQLRSRDQEIRETAAVALGIAQLPAAVEDLVALARDTAKGRALCARGNVDDRTRAFACYGLGLMAHGGADGQVRQACAAALGEVVEEILRQGGASRDLPVAAIGAMRLLAPGEGARRDRAADTCLAQAWKFYRRDLGRGWQLVQSHALTTIGALLGRDGDPGATFKDAILAELTGARGRRGNDIYRAAALALGRMAKPAEEDAAQAKYSKGLWTYVREGRDAQARSFCLMALGQIGGDANRDGLLRQLHAGNRVLVQPWAALALGVLAFHTPGPDDTIGHALQQQLVRASSPDAQRAVAIAVGLCRHRPAADIVTEMLHRYRQRDEVAGSLSTALALMDHRDAVPLLQALVHDSLRRPLLFRQAASALGKLGDKAITDELLAMLAADGGRSVARLGAVANALGYVGDRRTIEPLVALARDERLPGLARAFAVVALGSVADKQMLPWNAPLAADINYRAAVGTLTNGSTGVLDVF